MYKGLKKDKETECEHTCSWEDCNAQAPHPAPKSKSFSDRPKNPSDYHWFCVDHIREYNSQWDFFSGMSDTEVQVFYKESITGHRPTNQWDLKANLHSMWQWNKKIDNFTGQFINDDDEAGKKEISLPNNIRSAADLMEVTPPLVAKEIKKRYKSLVKRYHPDVNKGCKDSEEKFKAVSEAYNILINSNFITS